MPNADNRRGGLQDGECRSGEIGLSSDWRVCRQGCASESITSFSLKPASARAGALEKMEASLRSLGGVLTTGKLPEDLQPKISSFESMSPFNLWVGMQAM